jgi:sugar phosphate isomerase/epimerase
MEASAPPISVQLYSLREQAAADFEGVLRRLGDIGYVGVELAGFHDLTPRQFHTIATDAQLMVSSAHVNDASASALNASLDDLQAVGCNTVALSFLPPTAYENLDAVKQSAEVINAGHEVAAQRGVAFGYHNHWWEFETIIDGRSAWSHLQQLLDPAVFIELDLYWATVGGADPRVVIRELGKRLRLLHVKDGPADDPKAAMVAVGAGSIDIPAVLSAAPHASWHIVELDRCATDMFEAVEASYGFLTSAGLSSGRS